LPQIALDASLVSFISRLCSEMDVDGLRADLVMNKAARALAAWQGRLEVTLDDVRTAAELALPHRRRRKPFERPGLDRERLDEFFAEQAQAGSESRSAESSPHTPCAANPHTECAGYNGDANGKAGPASHVFAPSRPQRVGHLEVSPPSSAMAAAPGRRNVAVE